ncbi:DUF309 domain-containing protein [Brevibacillus daliensis]|uniref:DUF309 domain-containing protein n=1 Tax=Brevibacillus daliensis TaxID=2892995 RepID=UPI001E2FF33E|nr:DUF309 domain-containing protein [Brevibacillus daliensis]
MYPKAYLTYLVHFHTDRDYFECHEILEEYWKSLPKENRSPTWVCLIQIAVGLYHHRCGNMAGANKMIHSALLIAEDRREELEHLGLDVQKLTGQLQMRIDEVQHDAPYHSMDLPIHDPKLYKMCHDQAIATGILFGTPSDMSNDSILYKHKLRDRSEVIAERLKSLEEKTKRNQDKS